MILSFLCIFFITNFHKWDYGTKDISVFIDLETVCQTTFQKACSNSHVVSSMLCSIISSLVWTCCLSYLGMPFSHFKKVLVHSYTLCCTKLKCYSFLQSSQTSLARVTHYFHCVPIVLWYNAIFSTYQMVLHLQSCSSSLFFFPDY